MKTAENQYCSNQVSSFACSLVVEFSLAVDTQQLRAINKSSRKCCYLKQYRSTELVFGGRLVCYYLFDTIISNLYPVSIKNQNVILRSI